MSLGLVVFSNFEDWRGKQTILDLAVAAPPTPRDASGGPQQQRQSDPPGDAYVLREPFAVYRGGQIIPRPRH